MAIYIKDMKMPKRCAECPCYYSIRDDGYHPSRNECAVLRIRFNKYYVSYGVRIHDPFSGVYEDCPLIEVPEQKQNDVEDILNGV